MKILAKAALAAAMLAGTALTAAPASADVSIGFGFGPYYPHGPYYAVCDPRSRWFDPYRCDYGYNGNYYDDYYYGPVFIDGFWFNGPLRWRDHDGRREFFFHNRWREGSGFRSEGFRHFDRGGMRGGWHGGHH